MIRATVAYAELEILADAVRGDVEAYHEGRPARRADALEGLLRLLLTAETPASLAGLAASGEVRGLRTHLRALEKHLRKRSRLPEALCARYKYGASETEALRRYDVGRRTWRYFHDLARELDWDPALHVPMVPYEGIGWHDALEERFVEQVVVLDAQALEGMLIAALEAYLSPRRPRRKGYEVYGVNFGMLREEQRRRRRGGLRVTRYVSVMRSQPQLSAEGGSGGVEPNARSLDAILTATTALYPQYQSVGDFHSHPYDDFAALDQQRGWEYTAADESSNVELSRRLAEMGHRLAVTFVVAIARSGKAVAPSRFKGLRNTHQMTLGDCRVIVAAYRTLESGRLTTSNIRLLLSGTPG